MASHNTGVHCGGCSLRSVGTIKRHRVTIRSDILQIRAKNSKKSRRCSAQGGEEGYSVVEAAVAAGGRRPLAGNEQKK